MCPKCKWEPKANSMWQCSCGHVWNTFDTAARCPKCHKVWKDTQCLSCLKWSPHLDWYDGLDDEIRRQIEEVWELAPATHSHHRWVFNRHFLL